MTNAPPRKGSSGEATNRLVFGIIAKELESGPKRILDLGCGKGFMLQELTKLYRDRGWDPGAYLLGVDINVAAYRGEAPIRRVDLNEPLPSDLGMFDIIISIEVLEHSRRPYTLLSDLRPILLPGGTLIFSVPNPANMASRMRYLLYGHHNMFYGPSARVENAGHLSGHINPLAIQYWDYGLRYAGFTDIRYMIDRRKKGSIALAILLYPLLAIGTRMMHRSQRRYSKEVYGEVERVLRRVNHFDTITGRTLLFRCS